MICSEDYVLQSYSPHKAVYRLSELNLKIIILLGYTSEIDCGCNGYRTLFMFTTKSSIGNVHFYSNISASINVIMIQNRGCFVLHFKLYECSHLTDFMELEDLWCLSQVSTYLRIESSRVIKEHWGIGFSPSQYSLVKMQYHSAIVSLSQVSRRLIHRIRIYDPSAFPPFILFDKMEQEDYQDIDSFPPTIEPGVDIVDNENGFLVDRFRYHSRRLYHLLMLETKLNQSIFNMIKNKTTHSLDVDYHLKLLIDTAVHHSIIIQGRSIHLYPSSLETNNNCRAFAAVVTRLISQCTKVLAARSTTAPLMNSIVCFFEQSSYQLLSLFPRLSPQFLGQFKRSCTTRSDFKHFNPRQSKPGARNYWSFIKAENKHQDKFILILHRMTACCDLIGASFNAMLLKETQARCIILKLANIFDIFRLGDVRKSILVDLKETWFISHPQVHSHDFIDWFQSAIEK
ncbi:hypothetical protein K501DRAFT_267749 [Backusella circina FSU 941]|nr:hypothetical protein K501DRAFT_267749 [Backusella circina FSU 941]